MTVITDDEEEDALDKDSAGSVWADQAPASHWPTQGGEGGGGCLCELYLILCLYYTRLLPYTLLLTWGCYFLLCLPPGVLFHTLLLLIEAASLLLYTS